MYLENSHSGRNGSCSVARAVSKSTTRCVLRSVLRGTVRRSLVSTCEVHTRELAAKFTGRCVICLCRSCFVGESERSKPVAFSLYANRSEPAIFCFEPADTLKPRSVFSSILPAICSLFETGCPTNIRGTVRPITCFAIYAVSGRRTRPKNSIEFLEILK